MPNIASNGDITLDLRGSAGTLHGYEITGSNPANTWKEILCYVHHGNWTLEGCGFYGALHYGVQVVDGSVVVLRNCTLYGSRVGDVVVVGAGSNVLVESCSIGFLNDELSRAGEATHRVYRNCAIDRAEVTDSQRLQGSTAQIDACDVLDLWTVSNPLLSVRDCQIGSWRLTQPFRTTVVNTTVERLTVTFQAGQRQHRGQAVVLDGCTVGDLVVTGTGAIITDGVVTHYGE